MLLNFLWFGLILLSVLADLCSGQPFSSSQAALAGAAAGIELTLSLAGPSAFGRRWRGPWSRRD